MRNKILKGITTVVIIVAITAASMLDSVSNVPYVVLTICLAWLGSFTYVNREVLKRYE